MRHLKRIALTCMGVFTLLGLTATTAAPLAFAAPSTDASKAAACAGIDGTYDATKGTCTTASGSLDKVVTNFINLFSIIVGVVAVIMIMVGGFKFVTASGDASNVSSAKSTITYAVVGLVIVALAQAIVKFVVKKSS